MMGGEKEKRRGETKKDDHLPNSLIRLLDRIQLISFFFFLIIITRTFIISSRIKRDIWPKFSSKARNGNLRIHPLPYQKNRKEGKDETLWPSFQGFHGGTWPG